MLPPNPRSITNSIDNKPIVSLESPLFSDAILNNLPGMVYRCRNNPSWSMEYISRGAEVLTGYPPGELISNTTHAWESLIIEADRNRVWQEVQKAIKRDQNYEIVYRIKTKQDDLKWVWEQGCKVGETDDNSSLLEGIILDITEQKKVESALQESENRFRNIVAGSIEGICIHHNGRPLFANQTMANILGFESPDEIVALDSVADFLAPHERDRILGYIDTRESGEAAPEHYEFEARRLDGAIVVLENLVSSIHWEGQPAIQATYIDVTARKHALIEAEQQRQQLAHINRLNMLGEMVAGIAHEINQPLTAIITRCSAACRRIDSDNPDIDKLRIALEVIEHQAQRSGDIIQRLRGMANRYNDKGEISNLGALVQQCIEFAEIDGRIKDVHIKRDFNGKLRSILGDPVQIQQVILNLISNATDAMGHLPINDRRILVSIKNHDKKEVQVAVADCGSGISAETESKLFQSFFTTKESGMGMGLSISRSIIFAHGGSFWFTRNTERGVTFHFTLPIIL